MTLPLWTPAALFGAILAVVGLFAAARERRDLRDARQQELPYAKRA